MAKAVQNKMFDDWNELADVYAKLPPLINALHKAKFPRYFSTRKYKKQIRQKMFDLLFKLTKVEASLISVKKMEERTLEIIRANPIFSHLDQDLEGQNEYDTETVIRFLNFLDAEIHTLEGANAEVTGALVGVILGAILSIIISIIANLS